MRKKFIDKFMIDDRVRELAKMINRDYAHFEDRLCIVGVLRGAFIFLADLTRLLNIKHTVDFISIASYTRDESGDVRLIMDTRTNIHGKHLLIVDDIVDSGKTMNYLVRLFRERGAVDVKTCAFLRKTSSNTNYPIDYYGFEISGTHWVVGYGLDYNDKYRTLPDIDIFDTSNLVPMCEDDLD